MNLLCGPLLLSLLGATALTACSSKLVPGDGSNPERAFPVVCAWAHTTSDTSCPAGACPIVLDEELTCDDDRFGEYSVSVAPTPDATWLATSAPGEHMVYRLSGGKNERQEGIPDAFNGNRISLALGPDGAPQLIADPVIRSSKDPGNVTRAVFANGKWTSSVIIDTTESPRRVIDFAITPSGEPFLWFTGGPSETVELATSKGQGTWTLDPKVAPFDRYTLDADGSPLGVTLGYMTGTTYQLRVGIDFVGTSIGGPIDVGPEAGLVLAAAPPQILSGLSFGAALVSSTGIHFVRVSKGGQAQVSVVDGIPSSVEMCPGGGECQSRCQKTGIRFDYHSTAVGWTDDGTAWLTYNVIHIDQAIEFSTPADPEQMGCSGSVVDDMSTGTVHLVRIAPDGSAPTEVLSMPIGRLLNIDVRGSGKELAIGMATVGITGMNTVRVLRIDTTKL